ncbi:MAG: RNA polymerase sigma factor, partial [Muribaculaceae bacterium]|nr:RNA polymerase sigma factor [Muribaculaceae bacterium]
NKDLPSDVTAASEVERRENVAALRKAIKLLPENERKVVLMKAINGMSSDEIAESTGFTATNIRVLLHRGSKRIKEYLKKKKGIQGEHIYISSENWKRISEYFNFNYIPFGVLIGKDGNLIKTHFYLDGQNAEKEIERHLRE